MKSELILGDALEVLPSLPDKCCDYFLTSPPFKEEEFGGGDYWKNLDTIVEELTRITKKAGYMFNSSTKMQEMLRRYPEIKRVLIWGKQPSNYSFKYEPIFVWQFGRFKVNKYLFKDFWTMPPILGNENTYENPTKLYKEIMQMLPKGRVIDPFSGTGTTLRACRILNMDFIGVEIEKKKPVFDRGLLRFMEV